LAPAWSWIDKAGVAFEDWRLIRTQVEAQDFILHLFMPELHRGVE
jgi:hypothetical protein